MTGELIVLLKLLLEGHFPPCREELPEAVAALKTGVVPSEVLKLNLQLKQLLQVVDDHQLRAFHTLELDCISFKEGLGLARDAAACVSFPIPAKSDILLLGRLVREVNELSHHPLHISRQDLHVRIPLRREVLQNDLPLGIGLQVAAHKRRVLQEHAEGVNLIRGEAY